ncbi:hypothetical protein NIES2109_25750 [Nostoc sp. HK-01]|uniref:DUF4189 domain-containing protein n=1 Tax=Anabaenopsis circularis NIES-21 TaxID=1085406 RepID=A0A1Z4GF60_9CYAN|nr:hypothetical protein NIES21_19740 [Anabaenopsis circularis NIES-21]BBD59784.1 hypothetical protein NIES2109_25750 [Nostoc sp. HK-01]
MLKVGFKKSLLTAIAVISILPAITQTAQAGAANNVFGAISYSPSTKVYSTGIAKTKQAAINASLNKCRRESAAGDCTTPLWFKNAWGALAVGSDGSYGTGWGTNQSLAKKYAVETCQKYGGEDCQVVLIKQAR